jgi:hypothetical protein
MPLACQEVVPVQAPERPVLLFFQETFTTNVLSDAVPLMFTVAAVVL